MARKMYWKGLNREDLRGRGKVPAATTIWKNSSSKTTHLGNRNISCGSLGNACLLFDIFPPVLLIQCTRPAFLELSWFLLFPFIACLYLGMNAVNETQDSTLALPFFSFLLQSLPHKTFLTPVIPQPHPKKRNRQSPCSNFHHQLLLSLYLRPNGLRYCRLRNQFERGLNVNEGG